jgi:hypothetical protein
VFTGEELRKIVDSHIRGRERLGEQAGGSGHLGYVSYALGEIGEPVRGEGGVWEIPYSYTVFVETEFTYYPDNPPHEYRREAVARVDDEGGILEGQ